jgi:hypothetical protein
MILYQEHLIYIAFKHAKVIHVILEVFFVVGIVVCCRCCGGGVVCGALLLRFVVENSV